MGKLILSLIVFVSVISLPALSQAQNFRGGGLGTSGFGARGFSAGNSGSGLRGGFNRGTASTYKGIGLRNSGQSMGFVKQPALGQKTFGSGFSGTNRTTFGRGSNLTRSNISNTFSNQSQNFINSRRSLGKSINGVSSGSSSRSFNNSNLNQNKIGRGEKDNNTSRSKTGSTFGGNKVTNSFNSSKKSVFMSGPNLNRAVTAMRTTNFTNNPSRDTQVTVQEIGIAPGVISNSSSRTGIAHWVDKKSGIRHFSNNISSYRDGRETITFVGGKKVVSKIGGSNSDKALVNGSEGLGDTISLTKTAIKPGIRQANKEISSNNELRFASAEPAKRFHHKSHHKDFDHHHHRHHDDTINFFFFINPFFPFPTSTFFFGFNPFVFNALVLSPFTFGPFFPSPFFTFNPIVSSPFLFNNFVFPSLLFPSFCDPFFFGPPFSFSQFLFTFNDFHL